jgi:hypothetical protein
MNPSPPVILFVYNADSGLIAGLKEYVHKAVSPDTYECNLFQVTYGAAGMKEKWREFVDALPLRVEFLHRDTMARRYPEIPAEFPAAFLRRGSYLTLFLSAEEINACGDLDALIALVEEKLAQQQLLGEAVPA